MTDFLFDGPDDGPTLLLAHGAGAPMDSDFMADFARALGALGARVARFEFPYMAKRRVDGKKRGPGKAERLIDDFVATARELDVPLGELFVGGKSMGGRIASMAADDLGVAGLVCLGYPFHPPGKPESLRTAHLEELATPALVIQGERDPFGKPNEVSTYALADTIRVEWSSDGDHSLKPRKSSGRTQTENVEEAAAWAWAFIQERVG